MDLSLKALYVIKQLHHHAHSAYSMGDEVSRPVTRSMTADVRQASVDMNFSEMDYLRRFIHPPLPSDIMARHFATVSQIESAEEAAHGAALAMSAWFDEKPAPSAAPPINVLQAQSLALHNRKVEEFLEHKVQMMSMQIMVMQRELEEQKIRASHGAKEHLINRLVAELEEAKTGAGAPATAMDTDDKCCTLCESMGIKTPAFNWNILGSHAAEYHYPSCQFRLCMKCAFVNMRMGCLSCPGCRQKWPVAEDLRVSDAEFVWDDESVSGDDDDAASDM